MDRTDAQPQKQVHERTGSRRDTQHGVHAVRPDSSTSLFMLLADGGPGDPAVAATTGRRAGEATLADAADPTDRDGSGRGRGGGSDNNVI